MRRIVLLTSALVLASTMGIAALGGPAGAATHSTHGLVVRHLGPAKRKQPPNVNINTPGPVFSPTSVTGKKVSAKVCAKGKKYSFSISNTTSNNQEIDFTAAAGGGEFAEVDAGTAIGVCGEAKFKATAVFQLASNTSSTLTVTIK
jgi:hypothetical protein